LKHILKRKSSCSANRC